MKVSETAPSPTATGEIHVSCAEIKPLVFGGNVHVPLTHTRDIKILIWYTCVIATWVFFHQAIYPLLDTMYFYIKK